MQMNFHIYIGLHLVFYNNIYDMLKLLKRIKYVNNCVCGFLEPLRNLPWEIIPENI